MTSTATAPHPMNRPYPGATRCAEPGCGLTRSAKVHKVQKATAATEGAIAAVTVTETAAELAALYSNRYTQELVDDAAGMAAEATAAHAAGTDLAATWAHEGIRRAAALAQREDAPADAVPAVFAAQVAAILTRSTRAAAAARSTADTEAATAVDAPAGAAALPRWADRQRAPQAIKRTPEQAAEARAAAYAAADARIAAERAARVAELAAGPVPAGATWVFDSATGEKVGWLSEAGVVPLPAPAPAADAPVVIVPCGGAKRRQAATLGIRAAHVTVLAGRAYADAVTAVWPDARRPLDGTRGIGQQLTRLKTIADGASLPTSAAPVLEDVTGQLTMAWPVTAAAPARAVIRSAGRRRRTPQPAEPGLW